MATPYFKQNIQDWITQQWVILFGKKIDESQEQWLLGPFGGLDGIGEQFFHELADKQGLEIDRIQQNKGLIPQLDALNLSKQEFETLSPKVRDFYENTSNYTLGLQVKWNPFFKFFGVLLRLLFSKRIQQLNVPLRNVKKGEKLISEIIQLKDPASKEVKHTIWFRSFASTGEVVYSGVYGTCTLPKGKNCIKAVFPLPNGSATVILSPQVGLNGELILDSSGKSIGDSGFYFLLQDAKGGLWTKFIKSFQDQLIVREAKGEIEAIQTLSLWGMRVLQFTYKIRKKQKI